MPEGESLPLWVVAAMAVTTALGGREALSGVIEWIKGRRAEDRAEKAADLSEVEILKQRHAIELAAANAREEAERKRANEAQGRYDVAQGQIDAWRAKFRELEDICSEWKHAARRAGVQGDVRPLVQAPSDPKAIDAGEARFDGR